ncbi:MAG: hypothetical protein GF387_03425 [Candidatus Portnoybacteria bacterium]|nr:hypothetical protein [Candidatus Portnoybacteria bacterium]
MIEKLYKDFEKKKTEAIERTETKEKELTPEKEREIVKETVSENIQDAQPVPQSQQKDTKNKAKQIKTEPQERQVYLLTEIAFERGISHAIDVAKRLDNPYLLDEFHDALVDEFCAKLIAEGKLKEI